MINNHSTPGHPRIPVAQRKAIPMDGQQVPMANTGQAGGGQYNTPSRPTNGPEGRPSQPPAMGMPQNPHAGMVRVSPGIYRPQGAQPQAMPNTGQVHTLPARLPNGVPAALANIQGLQGLQNAADAQTQLPIQRSYSPHGWGSVGDNMAQITNRLRMNNFGFGEPMAGAMRPKYF